MKLTKWIPGNVKPVRVGVYQREYDNGGLLRPIWYCYWNGDFWSVYGETPEDAEQGRCLESTAQNLPWRGLAKEPK